MAIKISGETVVDDSKKGLFNDVVVKGGAGESGEITLNCENNSHGVKLKGPAHSAGADYTLTLPNTSGNSGEVLTTDGTGAMSWEEVVGNEISATAPTNPSQGALWTDTSEDPAAPILKTWNGSAWVAVGSAAPSEFAPVVDSVTLTENDPTGDRFTSQTFDVDINMLVEGAPHSQKALKGEVTAEFSVYPNTDPVSSVAIEAFPNNNQGSHNNGLPAYSSKARVYAPDTLGRWSWYLMYASSTYFYLYGGQPDVPHGQEANFMPYLFNQQKSYGSNQHYDKARYYPPTPNYQYHFVVTYHRSMMTGNQKVHCMRRPANGSSDWTFFWPYDCRPPEYHEATNTWYTAEIDGRNVYLKVSNQPFTSSGGESIGVTSGAADSDRLGIALGNDRVVVWWRHYSTGRPHYYVRGTDGTYLGAGTVTDENTHPKFLKFEGSYFWGYYSGKLVRSSDGINWTDVGGTIPTTDQPFDIYYNTGTGLYELYCEDYTNDSIQLLTSNNGGSTWTSVWNSGGLPGGDSYADMYIQGGLVVFQHDASSTFKEVWYPYNKQTLTLSGTGADYASINVNDVVRPAGSTDPMETGVITSISGTTIEINSEYRYQAGDVIESTFASNSEVTSRYLVIDATGAVTGTVGSDPGYVNVGPDTNQTLTFPATFDTGNSPDEELAVGTTIKVSAQATNSQGSSEFGPSNIVTPS